MQKYIYLTNWTDQGAKDTTNSIHRATAAIDTMQTFGARIYEAYWTTGPYDLVFMAEVPDAETAHTVTLALSRNGNVRAHAMRAFDRSEMLSIVAALQPREDER
ncbi:MAG: GYD domain-containing protein [Acidimicrobiia bacterium]